MATAILPTIPPVVNAADYILAVDARYEARYGSITRCTVDMPLGDDEAPDYPRGKKKCAVCNAPSSSQLPLNGKPYYCQHEPCQRVRARVGMAASRAS